MKQRKKPTQEKIESHKSEIIALYNSGVTNLKEISRRFNVCDDVLRTVMRRWSENGDIQVVEKNSRRDRKTNLIHFDWRDYDNEIIIGSEQLNKAS